jgi:lysophospholipase L1-like esterase
MKPKQLLLLGMVVLTLAGCATEKRNATSKSSPRREDTEWLDVWVPDTNARGLPRVLLIGDSITYGYYPKVQAQLKSQAYVARLATSASAGDPALLDQVALVLRHTRFDVIHLNNGLHGLGYTEAEYGREYANLLDLIGRLAPQARLILATSTPMRQGKDMTEFNPATARVRARNQIVKELASQRDLPVDDLFALVVNEPSFYAGGDGVHLVAKGKSAQAAQVAAEVRKLLPAK